MNDLVLVDTGIWIDYFHGSRSAFPLSNLLEENLVRIHPWIEGELRMGSFKNRAVFLDLISKLEYIPLIDFEILYRLVEVEKLYGKGLSLIDAGLYASVKAEKIKIWTGDKNLYQICKLANLNFQ